MSSLKEHCWQDVNFIHFDKNILQSKGFTPESIEAFNKKGLPAWVAPHINIDTDYYEPNNECFKIGEDSTDQSIYIDLKTMIVLLGDNGIFINSNPTLFRESLKLYAEMIEKSILVDEDSAINNEIPDNIIEEFTIRLLAIDKKAIASNSFWSKEISRLLSHVPDS